MSIEAPTDSQLSYLADLCDERGLPPAVVYSKADASGAIGAILQRQYDPADYSGPLEARDRELDRRGEDMRDGLHDEDVPF